MSRAIGMTFVRARDRLARALIRVGMTPNRLTAVGLVLTLVSAACLVPGAGHRPLWERAGGGLTPASVWPLLAGIALFLASAADMLDGAVARISKLISPFGAVLDSALDRFSDIAIYLACALHFAAVGNLTYNLLAVLALCHAFLISYVKARAENLIDDCTVGYWYRGERSAALLIAMVAGHIPAVLWQQATLPLLTVIRRIIHTSRALEAKSTGKPVPSGSAIGSGWRKWLRPWRHPRGSIPYDVVTGFNIAFILFAPWVFDFFYGGSDPLRSLLELIRSN